MGYTTIRNKLFQIYLSQCRQTCINNSYLTNSTYPGTKIGARFRELVQIETQQTIGSLFQLNPSLQHTSCSTCFYVSFRQPQMQRHQRNFHSKGLKESPPQKYLTTRVNRKLPLLQIIGCSCPTIQQQKTRKHCQTSNKCIKYQQVCCTNFTRTTSTQSNQQKHRLKSTFIEYIKAQQIQTCKTPKLKTFQSLLQCVKGLTMSILSIPATLNCERHLNCCQQHHPKTLTIQSKFQFDS
jgi:hypothetical protein